MKFKSTYLALAVLAGFGLALGACSSSSDDPPMDDTTMNGDTGPTADEQIAELQKQINALRATLGLDPIDIADLTGSVSDLQGQVANLQKQIDDAADAKADADSKAMTAKGKAIYNVLDPLGNATTATQTAIAGTAPVVAATYGAATKVTVANQHTFVDGLTAAGIDATANTAFTNAQAGDPTMLDKNNGFSGTMLTWADTGRADTMTVYTDISAPSKKLFSERYGGGTQQITSAADGGLDGAQKGVTGTAFDGRTGGTVTHKANAKSATTVADYDVVKLTGAYKDAAGSYTCTPADGSPCTSTASPAGITFSTNWTFTANTGAMVTVPDGNGYMTFGWWMRDNKTTASPLDNVAVFYSASYTDADGNAVTSTDALSGTAKYEGGAAGKYAWRDVDEGTAHGGHFTAKANLTASFTAGADGDTLSGMISEFDIGNGTDPDWAVTLSEAAITGAGAVARAETVMTQWAVAGNKASMMGGWEAQLSNTSASRNDDLPTGVAGAFNAAFGEQGTMVGGFGANITNPNPPKN